MSTTATKLQALANMICTDAAKGRRLGSRRQLARLDKYEDIRNALLDDPKEGSAVWADYCRAYGYSFNHTAYDFFA